MNRSATVRPVERPDRRRLCSQGATPTLLTLLALATASTANPVDGQTLTLADATEAALATHPSLRAAGARFDAAGEGLAAARAARLPGLSVSATTVRFQEAMLVAPLHGFDPTQPPEFDRTLVQGQARLGYTLFDGGGRGARIDGAGAMHQAAGFGLAATRQEVIAGTVSAYLAVLSTRAVLEAASTQAAAMEAEVGRASTAFDAGTAAEVELLRARAAQAEARAQEASARARVGLAERTLARLMGIDSNTLVDRPLRDVAGRGARPPTGSVAASPILGRAASAMSAAEARVSEERSGRLPTLRLGAGLLDFGTPGGDHIVEWQAGLEVAWPIFTGGARNSSVRRAEAEARAAREELAAAELSVDAEVDAALTALTEAEAQTEALAAAVDRWEEVARIEALALDAGSGVQSDLLRAQAGLFQARAGHARARYDAVAARVSLAKARGVLDTNWLNEALEIRP